MDTSNPIYFIIDMMQTVADKLTEYRFWDIPIWTWFICFIIVGMVISIFWRGARG